MIESSHSMKNHFLTQAGLALVFSFVLQACNVIDFINDKSAVNHLAETILEQYGKNINVPPLPDHIAQQFAYVSNAKLLSLDLAEETSVYNKYKGILQAQDAAHIRNYPSQLSNTSGVYLIRFEFFATKKPANLTSAPLVIQVPPLGSTGAIETKVGRYFANEGAHSLVVYSDHNPTSLDQPIDQLNQFMIRNTVAIQQALDFLMGASKVHFEHFQGSFPKLVPAPIDFSSIFSFGISLGGIQNTYLVATEPRIHKGIIIMGGGNLPSTLTVSREPNVVALRRHWTPILWLEGKIAYPSESEYEKYLRSIFKVDPLDLAPFIESRRVSMIISTNDNVVPTAYQFDLWEKLGQPAMAKTRFGYYDLLNLPSHTSLPTGHFDIILAEKEVLEYAKLQFLVSKML